MRGILATLLLTAAISPAGFAPAGAQLFVPLQKLLKREFGSDLLGGISIVTSVLLGEYLAGAIIVLILFQKGQEGAIKRFATAWFGLAFLVSLALLGYDRNLGGFQFLELQLDDALAQRLGETPAR